MSRKRNERSKSGQTRCKERETPRKKQRDCSEPTVINMFTRFWRARNAYLDENGRNARKQHEIRKKALLTEAKIETSLKLQFNAQVEKLLSHEIEFFVFKIEKEAYPYFDVILRAQEYRLLDIRQLTELTYKVSLVEEYIFE